MLFIYFLTTVLFYHYYIVYEDFQKEHFHLMTVSFDLCSSASNLIYQDGRNMIRFKGHSGQKILLSRHTDTHRSDCSSCTTKVVGKRFLSVTVQVAKHYGKQASRLVIGYCAH